MWGEGASGAGSVSVRLDDDIWDAVKLHPWKARPRYNGPITLVELHATRSGIVGRTPADEYSATINWFKSPNNINEALTRPWASMSSYIIGGGKVCRVMPDHYWPSFSLGHADPFAISIEIGQNLETTPFDPRDLELTAELCAEISRGHSIPVRVLPFLSADNHEAPGYVRHDRSANGTYYGKSDPGRLFDDRAFEAAVQRFMQEDDMAVTLVLGRDPAEPALIWVVYKDSAGHLLWKTHLKSFADMPKLGVDFPILYMPELRSVGRLA
mgnify:FL=1